VKKQRRRCFIADILIDRVQRKFGLENIPVNNATVLELNEQHISNYLATALNNLIATTDILSIKFINPGEIEEKVARQVQIVEEVTPGEYNYERTYG